MRQVRVAGSELDLTFFGPSLQVISQNGFEQIFGPWEALEYGLCRSVSVMSWFERPFLRRLLLVSTIVWLVCGVGLLTELLMAPEPMPMELIRRVDFVTSTGRIVAWDEAPPTLRFYQDRLWREVVGLTTFFRTVGQDPRPVNLQINLQHPERYFIGPENIEMGFEVARNEGQVRHALLKAWLLQAGQTRLSDSILRQEVLADVLSGLAEGEFRLRAPWTHTLLRYVENGEVLFFKQIATFRSVCSSNWRPISLGSFCHISKNNNSGYLNELSSLSLRQVLGLTVWRIYSGFNSLDRIRFQRAWLQYLKHPQFSDTYIHMNQKTTQLPQTIMSLGHSKVPGGNSHFLSLGSRAGEGSAPLFEMLAWAQEELKEILPEDSSRLGFRSNEKISAQYRILRDAAVKKAALDQRGEIKVNVVAEFEQHSDLTDFVKEVVEAAGVLALPRGSVSVVSHKGKFYLLPGDVLLSSGDLAHLQSRAVVWNSCAPPSPREVLNYPIRSERTLIAQDCDESHLEPRYRSFFRYGVEGFALDNPTIRFALVHRATLELADRRAVLPSFNLFSGIFKSADQANAGASAAAGENVSASEVGPLSGTSRVGRSKIPVSGVDGILGLGAAQWNASLHAYRARGAIEAIEWFRSANEPLTPN